MPYRIRHHPVTSTLIASIALMLAADGARLGACTTFCLKAGSEIVFGRNYDYTFDDALILVNKRGVAKQSVISDSARPAAWKSVYGSVTFNQYGRENPTGGVNEAGLVVEELWLDSTRYVTDASLPTLGTQEWIQYELDTAATVPEAIAHARAVRIDDDVKVHYMVSDRTGRTATLEFLNGTMVLHTGLALPVPVLTNDSYDDSIAAVAAKPLSRATTQSSLDRFIRADHRVSTFDVARPTEPQILDFAFQTLSDTSQQGGTQWTIVYDLVRRKVHFHTLSQPALKVIDAARFDYKCTSPVMMLDVDTTLDGDVTNAFVPYTRSANRTLIERTFTKTAFLQNTPASIRDLAASFPEEFPCSPPR